eukprot:COSAG06_NODE_3677_length_5027_cov_3.492289_1_plen_237_part_00
MTGTSTATESDGFDENPLSEPGQSDVYDVEGSELPNVQPATPLSHTQVAKREREAKNMRAQNQQLQTQNRQLQAQSVNDKAEIASLKAITTAKDESTKVQALQAETAALKDQLADLRRSQSDGLQLVALSNQDPSTATQQQATEKSSGAAMKELAIDEALSEETRESAKQALDELVGAQIKSVALESKNSSLERDKKATLRKLAIVNDVVSEDMTKWLQGLRLLHHADAVIRVIGM